MARRIIRVGSSDERGRSRVTTALVAALVIGGLLLASAVSGVDLVSGLDGLLAASSPAAAPETEAPAAETAAVPTDANGLVAARVTWVSDGDTLRVELNGATTHVRLLGIDTPESVAYDASQNSDQGRQAARHTEGLVHAGDTVWLQAGEVDHDRYGRILRWVWLQEPSDPGDEGEVRSKMLDAIVLRDGYAKTFWLEGRYKDLFERLESEAKASGAGLWATGEDWGRAGG
ncbi:MAG: thermonuclease family protein [Atopobiaceae bacterium]|jgi:micrococcal nuclease